MENQNNQSVTKPSFFEKVKQIFAAVKKALGVFWKEVFAFPAHILSHPVAGWQEFKQDKKGKISTAVIIVLLYVLMRMVEYKYLGPVVNTNNPHKFNSITILVYGVVPPILLSVANWSVTTLMDGKGKMKEIFMMVCYSFFPIMIVGFFNILISNFITEDEAQFVLLLNIVGWTLTGYMAVTGLISIHEYGLGKVVFSILLTALAAVIIAFVALLLFDLIQQMYGFVHTIYDEFTTRYM